MCMQPVLLASSSWSNINHSSFSFYSFSLLYQWHQKGYITAYKAVVIAVVAVVLKTPTWSRGIFQPRRGVLEIFLGLVSGWFGQLKPSILLNYCLSKVFLQTAWSQRCAHWHKVGEQVWSSLRCIPLCLLLGTAAAPLAAACWLPCFSQHVCDCGHCCRICRHLGLSLCRLLPPFPPLP